MIEISEKNLSTLNDLLSSQMGIFFPKDRWSDLERILKEMLKQHEFPSYEALMSSMLQTPWTKKQIQTFAQYFTVGETYFFRDLASFKALEQQILPTLIKERSSDRTIKIWIAGCCTGEEAYSIAIVLHRLLPDIQDWKIDILATDVNLNFLTKAIQGIYGEWSFRGAPPWLRSTYFKDLGNRTFKIRKELIKNIKFEYLNLIDDHYPSLSNNTYNQDIIFCRNVLIYFQADLTKKVKDRFYACLKEGGYLFLGASETVENLDIYQTIYSHDSIVFRKPHSAEPQSVQKTKDWELSQEIEILAQKEPVAHAISEDVPIKPFHKALELYNQKKYTDAKKILYQIENGTDTEQASILLSHIYANERKFEEAIGACKKAIFMNKSKASYHHFLGTILLESNHIEDAVQSFRNATYLDDQLIAAHFELANIFLKKGEKKVSNSYFKKALLLLKNIDNEDTIPETDDLKASHLERIIHTIVQRNKFNL